MGPDMKDDIIKLLLARQENGNFAVCHTLRLTLNQDYE